MIVIIRLVHPECVTQLQNPESITMMPEICDPAPIDAVTYPLRGQWNYVITPHALVSHAEELKQRTVGVQLRL